MITNLTNYRPFLKEMGWPGPTCIKGLWSEWDNGGAVEFWDLDEIVVYWDLPKQRRLFVVIAMPPYNRGDWTLKDFSGHTHVTTDISRVEAKDLLRKEDALDLGPNFIDLTLDQMLAFLKGDSVRTVC